jgi:fructose-bisphosphate aldolase/6-deoxy-5-ketofructose 1-phosphate synthase
LERLHDQIRISGAAGNATGRNIRQKPLADAVLLCNAVFAITVENAGVDEAYRIYLGD